jgi:hypothetical protein
MTVKRQLLLLLDQCVAHATHGPILKLQLLTSFLGAIAGSSHTSKATAGVATLVHCHEVFIALPDLQQVLRSAGVHVTLNWLLLNLRSQTTTTNNTTTTATNSEQVQVHDMCANNKRQRLSSSPSSHTGLETDTDMDTSSTHIDSQPGDSQHSDASVLSGGLQDLSNGHCSHIVCADTCESETASNTDQQDNDSCALVEQRPYRLVSRIMLESLATKMSAKLDAKITELQRYKQKDRRRMKDIAKLKHHWQLQQTKLQQKNLQ